MPMGTQGNTQTDPHVSVSRAYIEADIAAG